MADQIEEAAPYQVRAADADPATTLPTTGVETTACPQCGGVCTKRPGGRSCIHNAGCTFEWKRDGW